MPDEWIVCPWCGQTTTNRSHPGSCPQNPRNAPKPKPKGK